MAKPSMDPPLSSPCLPEALRTGYGAVGSLHAPCLKEARVLSGWACDRFAEKPSVARVIISKWPKSYQNPNQCAPRSGNGVAWSFLRQIRRPVKPLMSPSLSAFCSVVAVMLASIESFMDRYGHILTALEWAFTLLFTFEYLVRIWSVRNPWLYMRSFYGLVDLAAILPTYLSLMLINAEYLIVVRLLRVMRVFRILKLIQYLESSRTIMKALRASRPKITVFMFAVMVLVVIIGSLMHIIEGQENGFTSIPASMYWAVVTLTTVGYGDIAPQTAVGKSLAAIVMIIGYAIIAGTYRDCHRRADKGGSVHHDAKLPKLLCRIASRRRKTLLPMRTKP